MRAHARILGGLLAATSLLAGTTATVALAAAPAASSSDPAPMSGALEQLAGGGAAANRAAPSSPPLRQRGSYDASATGPGSLVEAKDGVLVQVFSDHLTPAVVAGLRDAGARIVDVSTEAGIATVSAEPSELAGVASVAGVRYVNEVLEPLTSSADRPANAGGAVSATVVQPVCGAAHSEGDTQLDAVGLRNAWGTEGFGVEVGVLSDSWNLATNDATSLAQDITSGDIPGAGNPCPGAGRTTPAAVVAEGLTGGADEGRAMAQIVHDLAPAAQISFATAFTGDTAFASNIRALRNHGADVIVDDVFYYNEPAYQNGPIGVAVEDVVASGAAYFSAIGNETETVGGHVVSSYEAQAFRPTTCPAGISGTCHDFDPGTGDDNTFGVTVPAGGALNMTLKWDEPWKGVLTDYDLYFLVDGVQLAHSTTQNPGGTEQPFENISATVGTSATNVDVVVSRRPTATGTPRFKLEHIRSDLTGSEYNVSNGGDVMGPNAIGHPVSPGGVGVGAIPYNNANTPEAFSSRGPATWYWGPVTGGAAAAHLAAPLVLDKPDIAATDGGRTTFFYDQTEPYTAPRFYGTSAAAPHAAAVAALLLACRPSLTPAQITSTLRSTAAPVTNGVPANVGAGRVNARAAGDQVCLPPAAGPEFSVSDASVTEGSGAFGSAVKTLSFTVSLSQPLTTTSSVKYQTVNGTAVSSADYSAKGLTTLSFAKGVTSKVVTINVKGDTIAEPDETMTLHLSSPIGAPLADADGVGTIVNDDVPPIVPGVSVDDVSVVEGNSGTLTKTVKFTVTLSAPAPGTITVQYRTANGSAVAPGDYTAKPLTTLSFSKGQISKTVSVTVKGDTLHEGDEVFFLLLTSPQGMTLADGTGIATIVDNE